MSPVRVLFAAGVSLCLVCGPAFAQDKGTTKPPKPLTIEIPGTKAKVVSFQTAGGWPLTVRLLANGEMGIGTVEDSPEHFPTGPKRAFIVFDDPDDCFSFALMSACAGGQDETYFEFTPTINQPSSITRGSEGRPAARLGYSPTVPKWEPGSGNTGQVEVGPWTGAPVPDSEPACDAEVPANYPNTACDNYGYGASPAVPGLVVLSNTGVGNVWEDDVVGGVLKGVRLVSPRRARNLAGFVNVVSWTLNDCIGWKTLPDGCANGRTGVTAHMLVPRGLVTPIVLIDFGKPIAGNLNPYPGRAYRIDGGPLIQDETGDPRDALEQIVTTLRVFAVSGDAPSELVDSDGDGRVTAKDAMLSGYKVLSDEEIVQFRVLHEELDVALGVAFDFNGDGMDVPPAPAGPGGIRDIPR